MGWNITITDEMRAMGLSGNELLVYALIHSCTMRGNGCYYGGIPFLCEVCGISRRTAFNVLDNLVSKELIVKSEMFNNGVKYITYQASAKNAQVVQNLHSGSAKNAPNNIDDNIDINNTLSSTHTRKFVKPTIDEIRLYCFEKSLNVDAEQFYNFYESKGWVVGKSPMKSWRAAVCTWAGRQDRERINRTTTTRKESALEHNLRVADQMFGTQSHDQVYGNGYGQK